MEFPQAGSGPNRKQIVDALRNTAQSASNMVAENVSVPVDAIAWALRKAGMPVEKPMFGSDWLKEKGVTPTVPEGPSKVIGDTIGMLSPMGLSKQGAKAMVDGVSKLKGLPVGMSIKDVSGPQSQALMLAQQRAALPVEQGGLGLAAGNTPAERAAAMGFKDAYHGTVDDITKIDPSKFGSATGSQSAKKAFWTSDSPVTARSYAEYAAKDVPVKRELARADKFEKAGNWDKYDEAIANAEKLESQIYQQPLRGQTIMPLSVRTTRGVRGSEMNAKGAEFSDVEGGINKFLNQALRDKSDLAVIKELSDSVGLVNQPSTHMAVFNPDLVRSRFAAFDPFRKTAATAAAMGVAAPDLLAQERSNGNR